MGPPPPETSPIEYELEMVPLLLNPINPPTYSPTPETSPIEYELEMVPLY